MYFICGYNKCGKALHYHHLDRKTKKFNISRIASTSIAKKSLDEELKKCIILCANCHAEVEDGISNIDFNKCHS